MKATSINLTALSTVMINGTLQTDGRGPSTGPGSGAGMDSVSAKLFASSSSSAFGGAYGGSGGTHLDCQDQPFITTKEQVGLSVLVL